MKNNHPTATVTSDVTMEAEVEPETEIVTDDIELDLCEMSATQDALLEQAIQSLGVTTDMMELPDESLELLAADDNFSTVNLNDLQ